MRELGEQKNLDVLQIESSCVNIWQAHYYREGSRSHRFHLRLRNVEHGSQVL